MRDGVKVSIVCNTYNHENYIEQALHGFLMQKTTFPFEILIHDDASTDGTPTIIRQFKRLYPDIIQPIYETENQYSKGVSISRSFQYPRAKGKYMALCEGDDYWIDEYKLQLQYNALEEHPEIDICSHGALVINNEEKITRTIEPYENQCVIPVSKVILGGGGYVATNSIFIRSSLNINYPEFRKILDLDYAVQIHGSLRGGMLYLPQLMSVYRENSSGSWSSRIKNNTEMLRTHRERIYKMLKKLDDETNGKYKKEIYYKIVIGKLKTILETVYRKIAH